MYYVLMITKGLQMIRDSIRRALTDFFAHASIYWPYPLSKYMLILQGKLGLTYDRLD